MKKLYSIYLVIIYLFFYTPIFILIIYSFNNTRYSLIWHGFTWHWYHTLFSNIDLWLATWHSLILGITAATIATFIGLIAATSIYRYRFWGRRSLQGLI